MSYADKVFINMCRDIIEMEPAQKAKKSVRNGKTAQQLIQ